MQKNYILKDYPFTKRTTVKYRLFQIYNIILHKIVRNIAFIISIDHIAIEL